MNFVLGVSFGLGVVQAAQSAQYPSRLWKVESVNNQGLKPSYLLGTMHLPDKDIVELPPHIKRVVDSADSLAIEVKLNGVTQKTIADLSALRGNQVLSDLIGNQKFEQIVSILKPRGLSATGLQRLKPWAIGLMLNYPPPSLDPVLDYALQLRFNKNKKPIYQLETAEEQIAIFNQLSLEQQIGFLEYSLEQQDNFEEYLDKMKQLYLSDDLDGLQALAGQQMGDVKEPFMLALFNKLIDQRNIKMANRLQMHLKAGNALIAIGALHLTGSKGLVSLLRFQGYRVTPVLPES